MKNGQSLNPGCVRYYLTRNAPDDDRPIGRSDKSTGGILYQLKNGCNWCDLLSRPTPLLHRLLALQAVENSRSLRGTHACLTPTSAATGQKKPKWTTLIIIDSQAVKNTCNASVESKGFCFYKDYQWYQKASSC